MEVEGSVGDVVTQELALTADLQVGEMEVEGSVCDIIPQEPTLTSKLMEELATMEETAIVVGRNRNRSQSCYT